MDLSILIPARNEMFLKNTIENILGNIKGNTEIIAVCDGAWSDPNIEDNERVTLIYNATAIGQRAAVNEAAKLSRAKFVMKLDAHCAVDNGFDVKLMQDCEYDWTVIPRMYNLHAFDWVCKGCGKDKKGEWANRIYQGPTPIAKCDKCGGTFEKEMKWKPRRSRKSDFMRFDNTMKFQYWGEFEFRPEGRGDICDLLSSIGACFFMHRERFWDLGGMDEDHGSWGQFGTEVSCKSWLSGGRQVVNKKTWFAHMFRTQGGDFGFPYPLHHRDTERAREHSRNLWLNNTWPGAKYPLEWLIKKFAPVPTWDDVKIEAPAVIPGKPKSGLVYYTDNNPEEYIFESCQRQLLKCMDKWGFPIVTVSQKPIDFGINFVMDIPRCVESLFKQILKGVEECKTENIFLIEHDLLYHESHFNFIPSDKHVYYYNRNRWNVDPETGDAVFYLNNCMSRMCGKRDLLLEYFTRVNDYLAKVGFKSGMGFSPPKLLPKDQRIGTYDCYMSEFPCIDIRHKRSFTPPRMKREDYRNERSINGWTEAEEVPGWGRTKGRFRELLKEYGLYE